MANMLAYGALGGVGGYADGAASAASYEQRLRENAQIRMEQERLRQQDRLELLSARQAGQGARGSGNDGDLNDVFDANEREKQYRFATGMSADQEADIRSGEAYVKRIKQFNGDGSSSVVSEERQDGWQDLQARKVAELNAIRKNVAFGKNAKHAADAESEYQDIGMAEGVRKKDGDYAGLLAKQGKGLYDNAGEGATFNQETGESKLNGLGTAKAAKERAEGGWYDRRTSNDTSDAESRRDLNAQRILLNSKIATLENGLKNGAYKDLATRKAKEQELDGLRGQLLKLGSDGAPAQKPGKTITTKGGRQVTVLED